MDFENICRARGTFYDEFGCYRITLRRFKHHNMGRLFSDKGTAAAKALESVGEIGLIAKHMYLLTRSPVRSRKFNTGNNRNSVSFSDNLTSYRTRKAVMVGNCDCGNTAFFCE